MVRHFLVVVASSVSLFACSSRLHADEPMKPAGPSFASAGKSIKIKLYEPKTTGAKHPAVIMLHGSDGWDQMVAYNMCAKGLVERGVVVMLIHYYSSTGTNDRVTLEERDAVVRWLRGQELETRRKNAVEACFDTWVNCVGDAASYIRKLPNVDPLRVGLAGFSLGGYLGVTAAAQPKFQFKALVEMFGGMPAPMKSKVRSLPPTLIVHGEKDDIVHVQEALDLGRFMKTRNMNVESKFYPECYHAMCDAKGNPRMGDINDAIGRMAGFFSKEFGLQESAKVEPKIK